MNTKDMLPIMVFAEGGTTNGTAIMKFKKGAFHSEKTVKPIYLEYSFGTVNPAFDTIQFFVLAIFNLSSPGGIHCTVNKLPNFTPNEFLFENHKDKGKERWEIFAWAVRDALLDVSGFDPCDFSIKEKNAYEKLMCE